MIFTNEVIDYWLGCGLISAVFVVYMCSFTTVK